MIIENFTTSQTRRHTLLCEILWHT